MKTRDPRLFYSMMPQVFRRMDALNDHALARFLSIVQEEFDAIETDIGHLYDSWFIETCPDQMVGAIAEAVGVRLDSVMPPLPSHRRLVANALRYRREKGTLGALAEAARDATGWQVSVAEEFEHLAMTQSLRHQQQGNHGQATLNAGVAEMDAGRTVNLREADGRNSDPGGNLRSLRLSLSRLSNAPVLHGEMAQMGPGQFTAHPLGLDTPTFQRSKPRVYDELDPTGGYGPALTREVLEADIHDALRNRLPAASAPPTETTLWGPSKSLCVWLNGEPTTPDRVVVADLSEWERPGPNILGFMGGPASVPTAERPEVRLVIADSHERRLRLDRTPRDLSDAARLLQRAIRRGAKTTRFSGCIVQCVENRLLVLPEGRTDNCDILFAATDDDKESVRTLGLTGRKTAVAHLLLSSEYDSQSRNGQTGRVQLRRADQTSITVRVAPADNSIQSMAKALENGLQINGSWRVIAIDDQLLVVPPFDRLTDAYSLHAHPQDPTTIGALGLNSRIAIDPELGRICLPIGVTSPAFIDWVMGLDSDLGANPIPVELIGPGPNDWCARVGRQYPSNGSVQGCYASIESAIRAWERQDQDGYIRIDDNGIYGAKKGPLKVALGSRLLRIEAEATGHPCIARSIEVAGDEGTIHLNSLFVRGNIGLRGAVTMQLDHCTIGGGIKSADHEELNISMRNAITGPIQLASQGCVLHIDTCIIDGQGGSALTGADGQAPGPATWIHRSTVLGTVEISEFHHAQDCLFTHEVSVQNPHLGSMDHCALPDGSKTPIQSECVDLQEPSNAPPSDDTKPLFLIAHKPSQPGYGRPTDESSHLVLSGASNGSEIGVYNPLFTNRRMHMLQDVVNEFLPVGWMAHIQITN